MTEFTYLEVKSKIDRYDLLQAKVRQDAYQFKIDVVLRHKATGIETEGVFVIQIQRTHGFKTSGEAVTKSREVIDTLMKYFKSASFKEESDYENGFYILHKTRQPISLTDLIHKANYELKDSYLKFKLGIFDSLEYNITVNKKKHKNKPIVS